MRTCTYRQLSMSVGVPAVEFSLGGVGGVFAGVGGLFLDMVRLIRVVGKHVPIGT